MKEWLWAFGNMYWNKKLESVKTPILEKKTWRGWFDLDNGHVGIYVLRWPTPFQAGTSRSLKMEQCQFHVIHINPIMRNTIYIIYRWPTPFQAGTFKPLYNGTMFFST